MAQRRAQLQYVPRHTVRPDADDAVATMIVNESVAARAPAEDDEPATIFAPARKSAPPPVAPSAVPAVPSAPATRVSASDTYANEDDDADERTLIAAPLRDSEPAVDDDAASTVMWARSPADGSPAAPPAKPSRPRTVVPTPGPHVPAAVAAPHPADEAHRTIIKSPGQFRPQPLPARVQVAQQRLNALPTQAMPPVPNAQPVASPLAMTAPPAHAHAPVQMHPQMQPHMPAPPPGTQPMQMMHPMNGPVQPPYGSLAPLAIDPRSYPPQGPHLAPGPQHYASQSPFVNPNGGAKQQSPRVEITTKGDLGSTFAKLAAVLIFAAIGVFLFRPVVGEQIAPIVTTAASQPVAPPVVPEVVVVTPPVHPVTIASATTTASMTQDAQPVVGLPVVDASALTVDPSAADASVAPPPSRPSPHKARAKVAAKKAADQDAQDALKEAQRETAGSLN